jgi:predicted aspartyl protease
MMLDTGSSFILARPTWLRSIGYSLEAAGPTQLVITASGRERLRLVRVTRVEALGVARGRCTVLAHEIPEAAGIQGLLGLDFLRDARLTLDFRSGTIELV